MVRMSMLVARSVLDNPCSVWKSG
eukprot:SAG22_NODE_6042_length_910_cov_1.398274_3_plen_23_part_01